MNQVLEQKVLNLSGESLPIEGNGSFQLLEGADIIYQDSTAFLQDYRKLMGRLSTHMHSRLWWATHISSKNLSASKIPIILQQIEACVKAIAVCSGKLIIYKPDLSLISALVNHCFQAGVKLSFHKWYVRYRPCIKKINQQTKYTIVPVEYWLSIKSILSSLYKVPTSCCVDKIK